MSIIFYNDLLFKYVFITFICNRLSCLINFKINKYFANFFIHLFNLLITGLLLGSSTEMGDMRKVGEMDFFPKIHILYSQLQRPLQAVFVHQCTNPWIKKLRMKAKKREWPSYSTFRSPSITESPSGLQFRAIGPPQRNACDWAS